MSGSLRLPCPGRRRPVFGSSNTVFRPRVGRVLLLALASEGRKESVTTPEASADRSDFFHSHSVSHWERVGVRE